MALPRLVTTGVFAFLVRVLSVFTGLAYVTLLTRRLATDAAGSIALYGYWSQIQALLVYPSLMAAPILFWATRDAARGVRAVGTSMAGALILSIPAVLVYMPAAVAAGPPGLSTAFLLAALILPAGFAAQALDAVARGREPRHSLYGLMAFEGGKVVATYLLLVSVPLSLLGAILGMVLAHTAQAAVLGLCLSSLDRPSLPTLKRWLRAGWLPVALQLSAVLSALDRAIVPTIYGRPEPTAFYNAALSAAAPVGFSAWLSFALYPMLLAGAGPGQVRSAGRLTLLFAVPMVVGAIVYAPSILVLLRPEFAQATTAFRLLALAMFIGTIDTMLEAAITGLEKRDFTEGRVRGTLLYTNLLVKVGVTSAGLLATLTLAFYSVLAGLDILGFVTLWATVNLAGTAGAALIRLAIARRHLDLPLSTLNPVNYLIASTPMALFLLWLGPVPIAPFLPYLVMLSGRIALAAAIYFTALALVDGDFRRRVLLLVQGGWRG